MKKFVMSAVESVRDQFEAWGIAMPRASARAATGRKLEVRLIAENGTPVLVGFLSQEGDEFTFRYADSYAARERAVAISAFPDFREVYRSKVLWPFFSVRLPPLDRDDVQETVKARGLDTNDLLRLLAELSARVVSSPYELRLA